MNTRIVAAIVVAILLAGSHWKVYVAGKHTVQAEWNAEKLAQAEQHATNIESARLVERAHDQQLEVARNEAAKREITIRRGADAARDSADGLRNELAEVRRSLPSLAAEACRQRADTLADILQRCTAEYRGMAEKSDRHASDVQTLSDAWPK